MYVTVTSDNTVRTIEGKVETTGSDQDIDVTRSWHRKPRIFRPDMFILTLNNDVPSRIVVYGGLVMKSGGTSESIRVTAEWLAEAYSAEDKIEAAPEWVRLIWAEAPCDVISWGRGTDPADVQVL